MILTIIMETHIIIDILHGTFTTLHLIIRITLHIIAIIVITLETLNTAKETFLERLFLMQETIRIQLRLTATLKEIQEHTLQQRTAKEVQFLEAHLLATKEPHQTVLVAQHIKIREQLLQHKIEAAQEVLQEQHQNRKRPAQQGVLLEVPQNPVQAAEALLLQVQGLALHQAEAAVLEGANKLPHFKFT